ncbi:type 1 glutamine amidotransferase domain-containing protein [Methylophaga lonarensis]|uniref:type 1 glutamine amidotransferase domain-containing protein n=1 Tax=Methylophaga lonarensis TaxID=999151 RepID=UPI003D279D18
MRRNLPLILITLFLTMLMPLAAQASERVLIVVTSHGYIGEDAASSKGDTGYFLSEVTHPYYQFKNAGFDIDIASPKGGEPPMDPGSYKLNDEDNQRFVATAEDWSKMQNTLKLSDIAAEDYSAIIFAGGHGTMWDFPDDPDILRLTRDIYESDGVVAAVCHGPAALVNVTLSNNRFLVSGREVSTFTNFEERIVRLYSDMPFLLETQLKERGAQVKKALIPFMEKVSVDGRLVTGQNPNSARAMAEAVVEILLERQPIQTVALQH